MRRREVLRLLGSATMGGALSSLHSKTQGQTLPNYVVEGAGPTLIAFNRMPTGYYKGLTDRYRVIVMNYPPQDDNSQAFVDSFTADHVCRDILAVANAEHADHFAWYGFSWGAVVGLQLAVRTDRLTALALGGWPPLGGQYRDTLAGAIKISEKTGVKHFVTFYRSLQDWPERDAVSKLTCRRLIFVGRNDHFMSEGYDIRTAPLIIEHREELQRLGWTVRIIDGISHDLGGRPDIVIPLLREFLDPLLLRG